MAAATWVARKRNGLSAADEAELRAWLAADPRHGAAYEDMDDTFGQVRELPGGEADALKAALKPGPGTLHVSVAAPQQRLRPDSSGRRAWMIDIGRLFPQTAAAAVAFSALGGAWMGWQRWQGKPTFQKAYVTARGQQLTTSLPDGSSLTLDTATQAEVTLYRDRREVQLTDGQAMFTVQVDAKQPFHVRAGALRITVVGTRFSVRQTRSGLGAGHTVIAVEEGRVRVVRVDRSTGDASAKSADAPALETPVLLTAGQTVTADGSGRLGPVASLPAKVVAPWREGRVSFDNTPLAQAVAEFERYGNTGLVIRDPAVAAMPVGGSYGLRQSQGFADALPQVLPVRLEHRGGVTEIVAR
jgi:transmembrane sensor